jgi:hypothetical protein
VISFVYFVNKFKLFFSLNILLFSAVLAAKKSMPHSPRKRKHVMKEVAAAFQNAGCVCLTSSTETPARGNKRLSTSIMEQVRQFYERDDISRMMPGKRDFVIGHINNEKTKFQKVLHK